MRSPLPPPPPKSGQSPSTFEGKLGRGGRTFVTAKTVIWLNAASHKTVNFPPLFNKYRMVENARWHGTVGARK